MTNKPFSSSYGLRFRGTGFKGTAIAGESSNIDFEVLENYFINGANVILENQAIGDSINFQVFDKNNILGYGNNVVLDQFAKDWYVSTESSQGEIIIPYPASLVTGLFVRLVYKSIGASDVKVYCNLFLHKGLS